MSFLFILLMGQRALSSNKIHIKSTEEFIQLSKAVNNGTESYSGVTVFLDADIDFSGGLSDQFEPIGKGYSKPFQGVFDGQGHTITSLTMNSSSQYSGVFGYSKGATIRNVVLDSSCSVVSSYSTYVGGVAGECSDCKIENTVNMADVSFTGKANSLNLGGIVSYLSASKSNEAIVRNCANYGSVTHSGTAGSAYIGGIVGRASGLELSKFYIQNCLNYGSINHNGTSSSLYLGGILGSAGSEVSKIENCIITGKITSSTGSDNVGSVAGLAGSGTTITHCYWTTDVGDFNASGGRSSSVDPESKQISLNETIVDNLNSYNNSWNKWLFNINNSSVSFKVNNGNGFNLSSQLVLLPDLAESEGHSFSGWFEDKGWSKEFKNTSIEADTILYGRWASVVTFDPTGGAVVGQASKFVMPGKKYGELPTANRTGYTFVGWYTEKEAGENITENDVVKEEFDHTLYAQWVINNYTTTFAYGNGTNITTELKYNETIDYPENPIREGYNFTGWAPKPERVPAEDITIVANWTEITSDQVKIVFDGKDMTREDAEEIIKKWTDENFEIIKVDEDKDTGEIIVIIEFDDVEKAKNFVDAIRDSSDKAGLFKSINFLSEKLESAATKACAGFFFALLALALF